MSEKEHVPASDFVTELLDALDLKRQTLDPMPVAQFLKELKDNPERACTAHALFVRAVDAMGEVDIDKESPQRQLRLRMLKEDLGYKLYKAFDLVRGSQRTAHDFVEHMRAAESGGYHLCLAAIFKGPPGSGKSMFVDKCKEVLEGQVVYTVSGCPVHENPINLLTLLPKQSQDELAKRLGLTEKEARKKGIPSLKDMLPVAGKPCEHCWKAVMSKKDPEDPTKTLDPRRALLEIEVIPQRLSSRRFGIATKTPTSSISATIARGNRGIVDMGELFDGTSSPVKGGGVSSAMLPLLDATNDRKLRGGLPAAAPTPGQTPTSPAEASSGGDEVPVDAILIGQTNEGAYKQFVDALGRDAGKITRRIHVFNFPYNTSVTDEELAYGDQIAKLRERPHFDPMSLKLLALLAVISRLDQSNDIDIVSRARIYDGEKLEVKRSTQGNLLDGGKSSSAGAKTANHPDYWTAKDLWAQAGEGEASNGLDMTVMFNLLSEVTETALNEKRFEKCVSSYELITFLRNRVAEMERSDGFTDSQKEVLKRCRTQFLAPAKKGAKSGELESEYQRLLTRQVFEIAAPDFERRAEESFQRYRRHAQAWAMGDKKVIESDSATGRERDMPVDIAFMEAIESHMSFSQSDDRKKFRGTLEGDILKHTRALRERHKLCSDDECDEIVISWLTLPRLADAIRRMLNSETRARLEALLKKPIELPNESDEEKQLRERLTRKFAELGYCNHCLSQALEYFKLNELWNIQS